MDFFNAFYGRLVVGAICLLLLMVTLGYQKSKKEFSVKVLVYSSMAIALATACSYIKLFEMPYGGSVTLLSMLFVVLIGYWFGPVQGVLCGVAYGMLQLAIKPQVYYPMQLILDYPLAFGCLGLSGFFRNMKKGLIVGYIVSILGRFTCHFLSGFIFFGEYALEGMNPVVYSALYNIQYIGVEGIITVVVLLIPSVKVALNTVKKSAQLSQ